MDGHNAPPPKDMTSLNKTCNDGVMHKHNPLWAKPLTFLLVELDTISEIIIMFPIHIWSANMCVTEYF